MGARPAFAVPLIVAAPGVLGNDTAAGFDQLLTATLVSSPAHGAAGVIRTGSGSARSFWITTTMLPSGFVNASWFS